MSERKFEWRTFYNAIITIALPIALQNLLTTTASMVDTIMIGSEGELSVAAVGICSQFSSLFFSAYFGFASASQLFFSQYWGEKNIKGINKTLGTGMLCMIVVALLFGCTAILKPEFILGIYTDKQNIIRIGSNYLRIIGLSYPIQVICVILSGFMRSTTRIKPPLISSIAGLVTNLLLNWILIYGRFGAPKLGVAGAAIGTLGSVVVNLSLLLFFLLRDNKTIQLRLIDMFHIDAQFLKMYFSKCIPIICNEGFYGIGQSLINIVIGHQSESAIAVMAAFRVLEGFVYAFFGGLADASSVVVGREVGSGHHMAAYRYTKGFAIICPCITFVICLTGVLFHEPLLSLFGLGSEALFYGKYMLLIYLIAGTIRTCNYLMTLCFRAAGETVFGTILETSGLYLISVPATWISGMILKLPFLAIFAFVYTDEIVRLIIELWYTNTGKWIKPITEQGKSTLEAFRSELKNRYSSR